MIGIYSSVPLFNLEKWNIILPVFIASLLIGLADEILRLVMGVYCRLVMVSSIVCGTLQIILCAIVLKVLPFWNPNFAQQLQIQLGSSEKGDSDFWLSVTTSWNADLVSSVILFFIVVITLAEIATTVYKTLRYGSARLD